MKKTTLLTAALTMAMAGTAFAADLPSRRAPPVYVPPPIPVFTWTGFYIGGQVGYEFGDGLTDTFVGPGGGVLGPFQVGQVAAAIGGAHVGYNYQLGGAFGGGSFLGGGLVVGLEGDIEGSNNTSTQALLPSPFYLQHKGEIEGSIRGRVGIAVDRALFYATGGAAFAQFKDTFGVGIGGALPVTLNSTSTSRIGYTVGGGMEYAITPAFSLRGEYRYTDFGSYASLAGPAFPGVSEITKTKEQKVELGFSYAFKDLAMPVVAKY